jgi:two-component system cell cycle sensor histidine kinase/response regulator CckA
MKDKDKTKEQLIEELMELRHRVAELEKLQMDSERVADALKESEEKYRLLVENANDAIFIAQDEVVKFPNPMTEEMIGYSAEELAKIPFIQIIHPEDRDMVLDRHKRRLAGEDLVPSTYSFRIINKACHELWVQLNTVLITWEGRAATLNFLRDITQQKQLEAQFQQAQKMEAIGTLAGGIAHDFNNLLMAIQGNTSLMLLNTHRTHPHYEMVKNIEKQVQSGAKLTKQLLGYARKGNYEVKPTNLKKLVEETSDTFRRAKKEITIHQDLAEDTFAIEADQGQIEQLLLNLYVNAADAMPGGGDLYLKTNNVTHDHMRGKLYQAKPGKYVLLTVTDTGIGIDKEAKERIFEPFFTTKEMGRGTGLGLASAYGIVKSHAGYIDVESEKGCGTTFNIHLPASGREIQKTVSNTGQVIEGSGTILLVDDEEMVLDVSAKLLKHLGYKVLKAKGGRETVEIYDANKDKIDLVILDMIMPDMGGGQTFDSIKELNPNVKVLLSSGYSIDGQARQILQRGCDGFIQKPFSMKHLSGRIRELLDRE